MFEIEQWVSLIREDRHAGSYLASVLTMKSVVFNSIDGHESVREAANATPSSDILPLYSGTRNVGLPRSTGLVVAD